MVLCDTEVPSGEKGVEEEVSHVKLNYGIVSVTMSSDSRHSSSQQSRTHCEKKYPGYVAGCGWVWFAVAEEVWFKLVRFWVWFRLVLVLVLVSVWLRFWVWV